MLRKFLAVMFLVSSCSAQDVYSVARQAGATVYDKVVAAQALCSGPCTIVFDSFLPKIAGEVLPEKCVNCTWLDYRVAIPVGTGPGTLSAGDDEIGRASCRERV